MAEIIAGLGMYKKSRKPKSKHKLKNILFCCNPILIFSLTNNDTLLIYFSWDVIRKYIFKK